MDLVELQQQYTDAEAEVNKLYESIKNHEQGLLVAKMYHKVSLSAQHAALKKLTEKRWEITACGRVVVRNQAEVDEVYVSITDHGMRCKVLCDSKELKNYAMAKGLCCKTITEEAAADIATAAAARQ